MHRHDQNAVPRTHKANSRTAGTGQTVLLERKEVYLQPFPGCTVHMLGADLAGCNTLVQHVYITMLTCSHE